MGQKIQTIIFSKKESPQDMNGGAGWTRALAVDWAAMHNFRNDKVDETDASFRLRQFNPERCGSGSFQTLTESFPAGVSAVSCDVPQEDALPSGRYEKRVMPGLEVRLVGEGADRTLEGHIAVFNQMSEDLGGFREKIAPGAFSESLGRDDIRALWNHNGDLVLGRTSAGTLELREDELGLAFKNRPPDTAWFKDRVVSLERKDVTGCSFGFYTDADEWVESNNEGTRSVVRTLKKVTLVEVSPGVTFPAYPQTDVALHALRDWEKHRAPAPGSGQPEPGVLDIEMRRRRLQLQRLVL